MSTLKPLQIDIVSDVVCPWCYIGKRRLEADWQSCFAFSDRGNDVITIALIGVIDNPLERFEVDGRGLELTNVTSIGRGDSEDQRSKRKILVHRVSLP